LSSTFLPRWRLGHGQQPLAKVNTLGHICRHHKDAALVLPHVEKKLILSGRAADQKLEDQ
jgi:hypothetical protein